VRYDQAMDARDAGLILVVAGAVAVGLGLLMMTGALSWFGRLPGDIRWESGNTRVYVPVATMIVVSLVVSLALYVIRWLR
jgi:hypothetical protein